MTNLLMLQTGFSGWQALYSHTSGVTPLPVPSYLSYLSLCHRTGSCIEFAMNDVTLILREWLRSI